MDCGFNGRKWKCPEDVPLGGGTKKVWEKFRKRRCRFPRMSLKVPNTSAESHIIKYQKVVGGGGLTEANTQSAIDWTQAGGSINTASSTTEGGKGETLIFRGFSLTGNPLEHPHPPHP